MSEIIRYEHAAITTTAVDDLTFVYDDLSQNPAFAYLASLSAGSRRSMRQALAKIALIVMGEEEPELGRGEKEQYQNGLIANFGWHLLTPAVVTAIRARLAEEFKYRTANKMLSALSGTIRASWRAGYIDAEAMERMLDFKPVQGQDISQAAGRSLTAGELMLLVNACRADASPAGIRDIAIIAVSYFAGLRRSEIVALNVESFNPDNGVLTVTGKRNKTRTVPVPLADEELLDWLGVRESGNGPLFTRIDRAAGGEWTVTAERMTDQAIYHILTKRADEAGIQQFSPHDLRRTFVSDLLDVGADLATVSSMAGHSSADTTSKYDRNTERRKQSAARKMVKPW